MSHPTSRNLHSILSPRFIYLSFCLVLLLPLLAQSPSPSAAQPARATLETGTIQGVVRTQDQPQGAAGITVQVWEYDYPQNIRSVITSTLTLSDGAYTLSGLQPGSYRVEACGACSAQNYVHQYYPGTGDWYAAQAVDVQAGQTRAGIDFDLQIGGMISGTVSGPEGQPLGNIPIMYSDFYVPNTWNWVLSDGESGDYTIYGLEPGAYRLETMLEITGINGYANEYYQNVYDSELATPLTVTQGNTLPGIDFQLEPGGEIQGRVVDASTQAPIPGLQVGAYDLLTGHLIHYGTCGEDGSYWIPNLPAGPYWIRTRAYDTYQNQYFDGVVDVAQAAPVSVAPPAITPGIDFSLEHLPGATLTGRVTLPDGVTPVRSGYLVLTHDGQVIEGDFVFIDSEGGFTINQMTVGHWKIEVKLDSNPAYLAYSDPPPLEIDISEADELNNTIIQLPEPVRVLIANVTGRLVMPDGQTPITQARVDISPAIPNLPNGAGIDHLGIFRIGGLAAGEYYLQPALTAPLPGVIPPDPIRVLLADPTSQIDLGDIPFLPAQKHIHGRVTYRDDGSGVSPVNVFAYQGSGSLQQSVDTDPDGYFTLDAWPGDWYVMIQPPYYVSDQDWIYMDPPKPVSFSAQGEETQELNFSVYRATASVSGVLLDPDGNPLVVPPQAQGFSSVELHQASTWNSAPPNEDGSFRIKILPGTYQVQVNLDRATFPDWTAPLLPPVVVGDQDVDIGAIQMQREIAAVEGRVFNRDPDTGQEQGLAGVQISGWQSSGLYDATTSDSQGDYHLSLVPGTWNLSLGALPTQTLVAQSGSLQVSVGLTEATQIKTGVDFELQPVAGTLEGSLVDGTGSRLDELSGWAYARPVDASQADYGVSFDHGRFSLKLPAGDYQVGISPMPDSAYSYLGSEQLVQLPNQPTIPLTFTMAANTAHIRGGLFLDAAHTQPATGLNGQVFATQGTNGALLSTPIAADGSFDLDVAPGTWNVSYNLVNPDFINNPPAETRLTLADQETFVLNFTAVQADTSIQGVILDPDGLPVDQAWAHAYRPRSALSAAIDTGASSGDPQSGLRSGQFSIPVVSGGVYQVGGFPPPGLDYIQSDYIDVQPLAGQPAEVTLQFKASDCTIRGQLSFQGAPFGSGAWVYAWSDSGQNSGVTADALGRFELKALKNSTWHIGAVYTPPETLLVYDTPELATIATGDQSEWTADLELVFNLDSLPPAVSTTFDPQAGTSLSLADGTRLQIPGGALPTTAGLVTLSITPMLQELPNTLTARPFGFGYAIYAYETGSGAQIVQQFNKNVVLTFPYEDADLLLRGVSEDDLSPAYFSTSTHSWTMVQAFTVDRQANLITAQVNHFTTFGLTMPGRGSANRQIYLPLVR